MPGDDFYSWEIETLDSFAVVAGQSTEFRTQPSHVFVGARPYNDLDCVPDAGTVVFSEINVLPYRTRRAPNPTIFRKLYLIEILAVKLSANKMDWKLKTF